MPKPPAITLIKERFIALHNVREDSAGRATSAPVTISRSLLSIKPAAAAAQPSRS